MWQCPLKVLFLFANILQAWSNSRDHSLPHLPPPRIQLLTATPTSCDSSLYMWAWFVRFLCMHLPVYVSSSSDTNISKLMNRTHSFTETLVGADIKRWLLNRIVTVKIPWFKLAPFSSSHENKMDPCSFSIDTKPIFWLKTKAASDNRTTTSAMTLLWDGAFHLLSK